MSSASVLMRFCGPPSPSPPPEMIFKTSKGQGFFFFLTLINLFRVAESRDQLVQINNRIFTAQAKIDKLRSASSKAARVFSSPKYPAPTKLTDYCSIYQDVHPRLQKVCVSGWLEVSSGEEGSGREQGGDREGGSLMGMFF